MKKGVGRGNGGAQSSSNKKLLQAVFGQTLPIHSTASPSDRERVFRVAPAPVRTVQDALFDEDDAPIATAPVESQSKKRKGSLAGRKPKSPEERLLQANLTQDTWVLSSDKEHLVCVSCSIGASQYKVSAKKTEAWKDHIATQTHRDHVAARTASRLDKLERSEIHAVAVENLANLGLKLHGNVPAPEHVERQRLLDAALATGTPVKRLGKGCGNLPKIGGQCS